MHQAFMLEVFAGCAILCAVAKQRGLSSSIAIDKLRKRSARSTIFQLDLTKPQDRSLLEQWMQSPLVLWVHLAPVCGTASRARNIRRFPGDPAPLRSDSFPEGLPGLSANDAERIRLANLLFAYSCKIFDLACTLGIVVTMENPLNSYFWRTVWVLNLFAKWPTYFGDFQVCMMGGSRDKWTRIAANIQDIEAMCVSCDRSHEHEAWGFASDADGRRVWATSLESQYPKHMCNVLVSIVLQFASSNGLQLAAWSLDDPADPLMEAQQSQMTSGLQPRPSKVPPIVPDFQHAMVYLVRDHSEVQCQILAKLSKPLTLSNFSGEPCSVPKDAKLLRVSKNNGPLKMGSDGVPVFPLEAAFGLPWDWTSFVEYACKTGHPYLKQFGVPQDLLSVLHEHVHVPANQMANARLAWCKKWLKRAQELDADEKTSVASRDPVVAACTSNKRILLTREILLEIGYEDIQALDLLTEGATLAGEVGRCPVFKEQYKPCLSTMEQLESGASKRNEIVLRMTSSSGDLELDKLVLEETLKEVSCGWAVGPFSLGDLEYGATVSRRFPLRQGTKVRMIDDFSISGVNDSCIIHNKIELHMIDTLCAVVRRWFSLTEAHGLGSGLVAKTFDLKSAYRQVPIHPRHRKFAYFSIYNHEIGAAEIYRLNTLPFGATHSVYCFLRLAKMLHAIATRALHLLTTNFYDDFILASPANLATSSERSMELIFMLTGWEFARDGKKCTQFDSFCNALGVCFDFQHSIDRILLLKNTESRVSDLLAMLKEILERGTLDKQQCMSVRGKLGFADSFVHGRLGALVLQKLTEHMCGRTRVLSDSLRKALELMMNRLGHGEPRKVCSAEFSQWFIYSDASYERETKTGGLGAVLVSGTGQVVSWFGLPLGQDQCVLCGADDKGTIIYELELLAAVVALGLWCDDDQTKLHVWFGDNDAVRFALIRASASGHVAQSFLNLHLELETKICTMTWFARVPTEANISDYPSRDQPHEALTPDLRDVRADSLLQNFLDAITTR